ncbi:helix-turn-helix protein [compost metagenome]
MAKKIVSKNPRDLAIALNLPPSTSIEWELRFKITSQIIKNTETQGLTITKLAKKSGTSRARITKILNGVAEGISLDVLTRVLGATGQKIEIKFLKVS